MTSIFRQALNKQIHRTEIKNERIAVKFRNSSITTIFLIVLVLLSSFHDIIAVSVASYHSSNQNNSPPPIYEDQTAVVGVDRLRLGAPDLIVKAKTKDDELFVDHGLNPGAYSTDRVGVKVPKNEDVLLVDNGLDLETTDPVAVKSGAAIVDPSMSPEEVISTAGALLGSSESGEEKNADIGVTRGEKDLKAQEVMPTMDEFKALQKELMSLKLVVSQRK